MSFAQIVGLVFIAVGLLVAVLMGRHNRALIRREDQTESWLKVPAVVRRSGTAEVQTMGQGARRLPYYGRFIHQPYVEYVYTVDGHTYTGNRIAIARLHTAKKSDARKTIARYTPGATVHAYVNPDDHAEAVLERSDDQQRWWMMANGYVLGGGIAFGGIIVLLPR